MKKNYYHEFSWLAFAISLTVCLGTCAFIWYLALPALTLASPGFWACIILMGGASAMLSTWIGGISEEFYWPLGISSLATLALLLIFLGATITGSAMFNTDSYKNQASIDTEASFEDEIPAINSWEDIPTVDKETARNLGDRSMGTMEQYLSQYEVDSSEYNLINYQGKYYRIAPLQYGGLFKYNNSKDVGIPAYVLVDVYTSEVELVELESDNIIRYAPSAFWGEDLKRHLRGQYPSAIFDESHFEIDEDGHPFYITGVLKAHAGLWGAATISDVVITDCTTGASEMYSIDEIPDWVDNVYSVSRIMRIIDWNYSYINGYWNFSNKGVRRTSYSYDSTQYYSIPKDGHVYVYSGVTSAGGDEANIGFILINMRNGETKYFSNPGAEESSAQESAKGLVQQYGYSAGSVMLVNISGEETYFFTLKDNQKLVKMYALVNKVDYTRVVVEDSIEKAVAAYEEKLGTYEPPVVETPEAKTVESTVTSVYEVTVDGNTMYIFYIEGNDTLFISKISNSYEQPAKLIVGSVVAVTYNKVDNTNVVSDISFK